MKRLVSLIFLAPLLLGATRVLNGFPVRKTDHSYWKTVRLMVRTFNGNWVPSCSGIIIAQDLILSAAHCVEDVDSFNSLRIGYEVQPLTVEMQQHQETAVDVVTQFKTSKVVEYKVHPQYRTTADFDHDLVVLKIEGTIPPGFVPATIMPKAVFDSLPAERKHPVELVGYGLVKEDPWTESSILRRVTVQGVFSDLYLITDQSRGYGGCHGDSGGPAYLKWNGIPYLVGVTHGPAIGSSGCHEKGLWTNPVLEIPYLNEAATKLHSVYRF
jgi:hypothetical protein